MIYSSGPQTTIEKSKEDKIMITRYQVYQAMAIAMLALPFNLHADSWSCRHDNNVREIHIQREGTGPVPCSVVYKKLTEGVEDQVLWTAENEADFCDRKAREFVAKQESWGWTCVETIQEKSTDNSAMEAPAEEAPAE